MIEAPHPAEWLPSEDVRLYPRSNRRLKFALNYERGASMPRLSQSSLLLGVVFSVILAACGSDATLADTDDPTATSTTLSVEESEVAAVADDVIDACQTRDRDRLRDLSGDQLRLQIQDQDYDRFFDDCDQNQIMERTVTVEGDSAQVRFRYRLRDGDLERECVFELERLGAGPWRLRDIPDCPVD
jgi:hypothetical protein